MNWLKRVLVCFQKPRRVGVVTSRPPISTPAPAAPLLPAAAYERVRCDVLLFVATSSEWKALRDAAKGMEFGFAKVGSKFFDCYYDLGLVGDNRVMAVETEMGPLSYDGSASRAIHAKIETGATGLICLGMAFGVNREIQKFGDILVARILLPYDNREVATGEHGEMLVNYAGDVPHDARPSILRMMEKESERDEWTGNVQFGALLTGGSKIRCTAYRDELVKALSIFGEPVIGGEMEGCGLLATSDRNDPSWLVVKGISDFADENRDVEIKEARPAACRNAARFILQALRDYKAGEMTA